MAKRASHMAQGPDLRPAAPSLPRGGAPGGAPALGREISKGSRQGGFSLVELMVAMLFTLILMAGLASVFKGSTRLFTTSGEVLSSARRNRMAVDLLTEDLNSAGMFITDLSNAPSGLSQEVPAFCILPNMPVDGAGSEDPGTADQILFYRDEPLPFEGTLAPPGGGAAGARSAAELVMQEAKPQDTDRTFTVDCKDKSYANLLGTYLDANHTNQKVNVILKDAWQTFAVARNPTVNGQTVTIVLASDPDAAVKGAGSLDAISKSKHINGSGVVFYRPDQMVRYSIKMKMLDPLKPTGVPCLVRDQGTYSSSKFEPDPAQEAIVTENVSGFKAFVSVNAGKDWAGYPNSTDAGKAGWTKMRSDLDAKLAALGRADVTTTSGNESWFRDIPTLVRVDIKTRTAVKRSEYSTTPTATTAYREVTQSLVIVPRHFGLPLK